MQILIGGGKKPRLKMGKRDIEVLEKAREIVLAIGGALYELAEIGVQASDAAESLTSVLSSLENMEAGGDGPVPLEGQKELPFEPAGAATEKEPAPSF